MRLVLSGALTTLCAALSFAGQGVSLSGTDEAKTIKFDLTGYRVASRAGSTVALRDQKLLVLDFTVQCSAPYPVMFSNPTVRIAVSGKDGRRYEARAIDEEILPEEILPKQKVSRTVYIALPERVSEGRLDVRFSGEGELTTDLQPLLHRQEGAAALSFANANDNGCRMKEFARLGALSVRLDKVERTPKSPFYDLPVNAKHDAVMAYLTVQNTSPAPIYVNRSTLVTSLMMGDDTEVLGTGHAFEPASDRFMDTEIAPGKSATYRVFLRVPKDAKPVALRLKDPQTAYRTLTIRL